MAPLQAVFFDLDDTLIDDTESARICIEQTCLQFQACVPGFDRALVAQTFAEISRRFWREDTSAQELADYVVRLSEVRTANWSAALDACGIRGSGLGKEFGAVYGTLRDEMVITFDDAEDVLRTLYGRVRLVVVTNGPGPVQRQKLEASGLAPYFDAVIACTDIDAAKPDAAIFQAGLRAANTAAENAWHVGDNLVADVAGAVDAGLSAAWLNRRGRVRNGEAAPHAEIITLRDLPAVLGIQ